MAHIKFLDETCRDGQQSLWGMRMQAAQAYPVLPTIDETGYSTISLAGSSLFEVLVRHCQEDPWAGFDLMMSQIKNTPVRGGTDGSQFTERGLPTPNLFTGMQNVHGPLEYISLQDMARATQVCIELAQLWSQRAADAA